MTATTIQDLARIALEFFETRTRDSGETFETTRDDAPDWIVDMIRDAHGDFLPEDWRYSTIRDAVSWIADNPSADDDSGEFADSAVDTDSHARLQWLASNLNRAGYVDDACEEMGADPGLGIIERIGWGQCAEASEIYGSVYASLLSLQMEYDDAA